ncbi:hypothetical protein OUZ56_021099 [Daphnia magna]|uniref:Uncharacterized protein n=1 Tax=Daphnia magna TaxID=35525 RepID=A0ABQ9ZGD8_9CRUS|nr:hypothetical protein OUZ56_021099 [Daphnia magna]
MNYPRRTSCYSKNGELLLCCSTRLATQPEKGSNNCPIIGQLNEAKSSTNSTAQKMRFTNETIANLNPIKCRSTSKRIAPERGICSLDRLDL